jgi:hypothetical protein
MRALHGIKPLYPRAFIYKSYNFMGCPQPCPAGLPPSQLRKLKLWSILRSEMLIGFIPSWAIRARWIMEKKPDESCLKKGVRFCFTIFT